MTSDDPEIATLGTRLVYANRWMRVREDAIRRQDGSHGIYGVVEKPDFVIIAPVEPDGAVHLVEQYRYPVQARHWEFPQGSWQHAPDADPSDMARGELQEETGLHAARMTYAGRLLQAYGYATQGFHVFLAQDLRPGQASLEHEEQGLISRAFSPGEFTAMISNGPLVDAATIAAFCLLQSKGLWPSPT
jgi:ADP-ribose pyrophosphatase